MCNILYMKWIKNQIPMNTVKPQTLLKRAIKYVYHEMVVSIYSKE